MLLLPKPSHRAGRLFHSAILFSRATWAESAAKGKCSGGLVRRHRKTETLCVIPQIMLFIFINTD